MRNRGMNERRESKRKGEREEEGEGGMEERRAWVERGRDRERPSNGRRKREQRELK